MSKSRIVRLNNGSTVHVSNVKERLVKNLVRGSSLSKGVDRTVHSVLNKTGKSKLSVKEKRNRKKKVSS